MKKVLLMLSALVLLSVAKAQKPTDYALWTGASYDLRLVKKLHVGLLEEARFKDTISSMKNLLTDLDLSYHLNKHFDFATHYRFTGRPGKKNRNRLAFDAYYKWSRKKFPIKASDRLRFQKVFGKPQTYIRNKIKVGYNLCKLVDPYFSQELYFRFNTKNEFRKNRLTFGLDWRILKHLHMETFYRLESEFNIKIPNRQHIIGLVFCGDGKLKRRKTAPGML